MGAEYGQMPLQVRREICGYHWPLVIEDYEDPNVDLAVL